MEFAVGCPHLDVLKMVMEAGILRLDEDGAAEMNELLVPHGRLDLTQRVFQLYSPPRPRSDGDVNWKSYGEDVEHDHILCIAAEEGHVDVMQYLFDEGADDQYPDSLFRAVRKGHLNAVKWLLNHHSYAELREDERVIEEAARNGRLEIIQLLHDLDSSAGRKPPSSTQSAETSFWWSRSYSTMDLAASNGHLDVVQWLHLNRPRTCSSNAMDAAAANGYLDVVKWLHANRSEGCTKSAMDIAASNGHLDVIQWLYVNNSVGCSTLAMLHSGHDHVSIF
ncbi:hypothetical protein PC128_g2800 [Phytophthora cactorum]|nr:hypothetical protein PC117_g3454 [Phytophthora cactorum]KAG3099946.1 hypothetical protein PC122_g3322 [Phytophthora cactorum]KAG3203043.1 hypothetical protein PC128_g2800 [Phytophthora cactorum]